MVLKKNVARYDFHSSDEYENWMERVLHFVLEFYEDDNMKFDIFKEDFVIILKNNDYTKEQINERLEEINRDIKGSSLCLVPNVFFKFEGNDFLIRVNDMDDYKPIQLKLWLD
jgi:hypothetical protein